MCKSVRFLLAGLVITGLLGLHHAAQAVTYEDSFTNCNYPKIFDLIVMRPISFMALMAGSFFFVPVGTLAAATVPEDFGVAYESMVGSPARFTFKRRLGECRAIDLTL